jgi:hypothetical protein
MVYGANDTGMLGQECNYDFFNISSDNLKLVENYIFADALDNNIWKIHVLIYNRTEEGDVLYGTSGITGQE